MGETDGPIGLGRMSRVQRGRTRLSDLGRKMEDVGDRITENSTRTRATSVLSAAEMVLMPVYAFLCANNMIDDSLSGLAAYCTLDFTVRALTGYGLSEEIGRPVVNLARKTGRATRRGIEYIGDKALRKAGSTFYKINR